MEKDSKVYEDNHCYDEKLSDGIVAICKNNMFKNIYDFGCGPGKYVKHLNDNNFNCKGYDGNPSTNRITNCSVLDLTSNFQLEKADFLICLEVGEHVPKTFEEKLISNITNHVTDKLLLSWAVVGQAGHGHVNCQNNDYVIRKFESMNFQYNQAESETLRNVSTLPWFKNTVMVFDKI